jgi:hypothetical protein
MSNDDENDLTDEYKRLLGSTLAETWDEHPDPPEGYVKANPHTIIESTGETAWVWNAMESEEWIQYDGDSVDIEDNN